jgi:Tol biopolymer transport system component
MLIGLLLVCVLALAPAAHATYPGANGQIAFGTNGIELTEPDGSGRTTLLDVDGFEVAPAWSPDGSRLAFEVMQRPNPPNFESAGIWVADADGTDAHELVAGVAEQPAWSPDGQRLVFAMQTGNPPHYDLYTVNVDGTGLSQLTTSPSEDERQPSWSVGNRIAFFRSSGPGTPAGVWFMETPGSPPAFVAAGSHPDWSPFGDELAIDAVDGIRRIKVNTTSNILIVGGLNVTFPGWAPDGRSVLYTIPQGGGGGMTCCSLDGQTWIASYDGASATLLTDHAWQPAWRPLPMPPAPRYVRPKGATPVRASLVPAFRPCGAPDRTHGPPLAFGSCSTPGQTSSTATVGTPDANGQQAQSVGAVQLQAQPGNPSTPLDEADVQMVVTLSDVRRASDLSDYPWSLDVPIPARITERNGTDQYTMREPAENTALFYTWPLRVAVPCVATADAAIGSDCDVTTTLDAVLPNSVLEGRRGVWGLDQVRVYDAGADADASTTDDNEMFAVQGLFVP